MDIGKVYQAFLESEGVATDTRKSLKNKLFVALKGENFDGNKYALEAIENGAFKAIVSDANLKGEHFIQVEDTLETLQNLAKFHRYQLGAIVIAITGSNGKTTTKELLLRTVSTKYKALATPGNFNNHIGLPLTILSSPSDIELLILEMGDNQPGDILELCQIANPDLGYITNIGKDHLAGYENGFEGNVASKKELFDYLESTNKPVFVNERDTLLMSISPNNNRILFGAENQMKSTFNANSAHLNYINPLGQNIETQLVGVYNLLNIEAVYTIARHLEIDIKSIDKAIASYTPDNNRSQLIQTGKNQILMDAYNANPSSVRLALESLAQLNNTTTHAILGDMLELGSDSITEHQDMVDLAHQLNLSAFFVGNEYGKCKGYPNQQFFSFKNEAVAELKRTPILGKTILLKGSRGLEMETLKEFL